MRILFDTNVLIAGCLPGHPHFEAARAWLDAAVLRKFEFVVSAHSIAEAYRVMTAIPYRPPLTTIAVWQILRLNVLQHAGIVGLSTTDHLKCLQNVAIAGQRSGIIYDALIVQTAVATGADRILTINQRHFQQLWPYDPAAILNPLTTPAP